MPPGMTGPPTAKHLPAPNFNKFDKFNPATDIDPKTNYDPNAPADDHFLLNGIYYSIIPTRMPPTLYRQNLYCEHSLILDNVDPAADRKVRYHRNVVDYMLTTYTCKSMIFKIKTPDPNERCEFHIPLNPLRLFTYLDGNFPTAAEVELGHDNIEEFRVFRAWLYHGVWGRPDVEILNNWHIHLERMWKLGGLLACPGFQNMIMKKILHLAGCYDTFYDGPYPRPHHVRKAYDMDEEYQKEHGPAEPLLLKRFMTHCVDAAIVAPDEGLEWKRAEKKMWQKIVSESRELRLEVGRLRGRSGKR